VVFLIHLLFSWVGS